MLDDGGKFSSLVSRVSTIKRILENEAILPFKFESNLTIRHFIYDLCYLSFILNA